MIDLNLFQIHMNPEQVQLDQEKDPMFLGDNDMDPESDYMNRRAVHLDLKSNDMNQ